MSPNGCSKPSQVPSHLYHIYLRQNLNLAPFVNCLTLSSGMPMPTVWDTTINAPSLWSPREELRSGIAELGKGIQELTFITKILVWSAWWFKTDYADPPQKTLVLSIAILTFQWWPALFQLSTPLPPQCWCLNPSSSSPLLSFLALPSCLTACAASVLLYTHIGISNIQPWKLKNAFNNYLVFN